MPYFEHRERLFYFCHCPKAGGTSVELYLEARFGKLGLLDPHWWTAWFDGAWQRGHRQSSPQHLTWADAGARLPRSPDLVFAVVRDPLERLRSEYRFLKSTRGSGRMGSFMFGHDFSSWLRIMLTAARSNPYLLDNHFRPQTDLMPSSGVAIFRLEDGLDPLVAWLDEKTGSTAPGLRMTRANTTSGGDGIRVGEDDKRLIAARFRSDYDRFGYALPVTPGLPGHRPSLAAAGGRLGAVLKGHLLDRAYRRGRI